MRAPPEVTRASGTFRGIAGHKLAARKRVIDRVTCPLATGTATASSRANESEGERERQGRRERERERGSSTEVARGGKDWREGRET